MEEQVIPKEELMPMGIHEGLPMSEVPKEYLKKLVAKLKQVTVIEGSPADSIIKWYEKTY
jgi:hypothetical protein